MQPEDSFISRWVGWLLLPLATAAAGLIAVAAKEWLGVEVDTAEIAAWILSVATGFSIWLYNRGRYEVAKATGLDGPTIDAIVQKVIEEKLPASPQAPAPGAGSPAAPGAPPTPSGPGGISSGQ